MTTKSNLTLVTALFDIGRSLMNNSFARSFDHYKESFSRLLKIKHLAMVIFCDPSLEQFIWEYRDRNNTKLIFKTEEDLKQFPFYTQIQNIRNNPKWYNQAGWLTESTQAKLPLYNPLVMSKQFFLNDATLFNFFDSNYFLWVDAGLANTVHLERYLDENFQKRIISKLNKMLYVCFPYDGKTEVHGFEKNKLNEYCGEESTYVARGGIFGGPKHLINELNAEYYNLLNETISNGYMGTEESIFTIITYQHKKKCNLEFIESNGLVYKFLEDLNNQPVTNNTNATDLAFYSLTYNTPKQFKMFIDAFKKAYPSEFKTYKKYVIDNSTDRIAKEEYRKLFSEYDFEIIHEGENIGINDGRVKAAKHFDESDHKYYIFFEEDFLLIDKDDKDKNKDGFVRYIDNIFINMIRILEEEQLDYLKMTMIEYYGDNLYDWAFKNVPDRLRETYYPKREDGDEDLRWKTKIHYLGKLKNKNIAYAVADTHYSNWPILFSKKGNKQVFLTIPFEHLYEQTLMSQAKTFMVEGKLKVGTLLAAPIEHNRVYHYATGTRRENKHYKN